MSKKEIIVMYAMKNFFQNVALFEEHGYTQEEVRRQKLRPYQIKERKKRKENCFLSGENMEMYFHDMNVAVEYAKLSRRIMAETIIENLKLDVADTFATIHNYIDTEYQIIYDR